MPWADVCEEIYVIGKGYPWPGPRRPNIYCVPTIPSRAKNRPDHPTPKPVELLTLLMEHSPPGIVADPFMGSGPTLLAAKMAGRVAIGIDTEERYCEMTAKRLEELNAG